MGDRPKHTAEIALGELIKRARERQTPSLSVTEAKRRAGVSRTWWQDVERGFKNVGQGHYPATRVDPDTLRDMAYVVGVTPDELEQVGRGDAAELLRATLAGRASAEHDEYAERLAALDLTPEHRTLVERLLGDRSDDAVELGQTLVQIAEHAPAKHAAETLDLVQAHLAERDHGLSLLARTVRFATESHH